MRTFARCSAVHRHTSSWRLAIGVSATLLALATTTNGFAADVNRGRLLYENHCLGCHESVVHIREQRSAHDLKTVEEQIRRWRDFLELEWKEPEVQDVLASLNTRFYRFAHEQ